MAETWGISGPAFLVIYSGLVAVTTLIMLISRRRRQASPRLPADGPGLDAYDLAMLNGGERLVVGVATANLRQAGAVIVEEGQLRVAQPLPHGVHPVERGVYQALDEASSARLWSVEALAARHPAVMAVRERLIHQGLLHPRGASSIRRLALWFLPVLALGIARLVAGIANSNPAGYLLVLLTFTVGLSLWVVRRPTPQTPSGRRLLEQARATGAPNGLELGGLGGTVALLGLGELWNSDGELADALGVRREAQRAASNGHVNGCGGGSCGGGGCGGGCGGCGGCGG
ncbi:MAG: TIGR04222 domain-containing membrane protein [Egibacteraceae bacterium]